METRTHTILVVDDTQLNLELLSRILQNAGYAVRKAGCGESALQRISEEHPDLILLDMMLPGMNGLEICKHLQSDPILREIPIIFITAVTKADKIAEAFNEGAVDYVVKPFNKTEVLARVKTHLRLSDTQRELKRLNALALDSNPLTRLPGNNSINQKLQSIIDKQLDVAVVYADLDNFKPYNDVYGYLKGDDAIRILANILTQSVCKDKEDNLHFVGHIGGDDFVLVLPFSEITTVAEEIKVRFDDAVTSLYTEKDLVAGGISTTNRQGNSCFFPLLSLSMGGIHITSHQYTHVPQIAAECAEVKKKAKQIKGTGLYMDRRKS